MDVITTITEFKLQLTVRGYAKSTIKNYGIWLDQFAAWLTGRDITDCRQITRKTMQDYRDVVMAGLLALETKALKIRAVKRLFEHLTATHRLLVNPAEGLVETCRVNRKIQPTLTQQEMKRLLAQPNLSLHTGIRDRAIMEVMYATAIRLNELINLEVYYADLADRVLFIRKGKGGNKRAVPLSKTAAAYLKEYLSKIRPLHVKKNPKERKLFLTQSGRPLTKESVQFVFQKYRRSAGIRKPVSPHTIRRTCATHLLQEGADILYIQKLLGHRFLSTTMTYTKVMPVEVKKTHEKCHPGIKDNHED